jgi:hypothetical protein
MSANSQLVHPAASASDVSNVSHPVRPAKLTRRAATAQPTIQHKPAKKVRNIIPPIQRLRVMEKYAMGRNQTAIAREEGLNRETIGRIVKSAEMEQFTEEIRERWRGLCDAAVESVRRLIAKDDRQTVLRVLESNGILAPQGQIQNLSAPTATKPNEDDRMKTLRACFADVMMERARVYKVPFPELAEIADKNNINLDFALNGASDETEDDDDEI